MSRVAARNALTDESKTILRCSVRSKYETNLDQSSDLKKAEVDYIKSRYKLCCYLLTVLSDEYDKFYSSKSKLNMKSIPAILDFAGYDYSKEVISCIFGSESKKGMRSIRYMIEKSDSSSFDEIHKRFETLNGYLAAFLSMINDTDG